MRVMLISSHVFDEALCSIKAKNVAHSLSLFGHPCITEATNISTKFSKYNYLLTYHQYLRLSALNRIQLQKNYSNSSFECCKAYTKFLSTRWR